LFFLRFVRLVPVYFMLLANVPFIPSLFLSYQQEINQNKSGFFRSGIIAQNQAVGDEFAKGGRTITIPHFNDLSGPSEILSDVVGLTAAVLGGNRQVGVRNLRGRAWQSSDLAAELAGDDPMLAIARRTGEYWVRDCQAIMISILKGLFGTGGPLIGSHTAGGTGTQLSGGLMIDAIAKLGDAGQDLGACAMHSAPYYKLVKDDLIIPAQQTAQIDTRVSAERAEFGTYLGRPVIVDDALPVNAGAGTGGGVGANTYDIYFFGAGSMVYSEILPKTPVETDRDVLRGIEVLVNRKEFLLHPVGLSWTGAAAGNSPSNAEFATPTNWSKVFSDDRNIKIIKLEAYL
jgi:hypothetical protein